MQTIWKYTIEPSGKVWLQMPKRARVLTVQPQRGAMCIWVQVDTEQPKEWRTFYVVGTGHQMPDRHVKYIGTFQLPEAGLVFHVFEDNEIHSSREGE